MPLIPRLPICSGMTQWSLEPDFLTDFSEEFCPTRMTFKVGQQLQDRMSLFCKRVVLGRRGRQQQLKSEGEEHLCRMFPSLLLYDNPNHDQMYISLTHSHYPPRAREAAVNATVLPLLR